MKRFELHESERETLFQVQEVIKNARKMDATLLRAILEALAPQSESEQFRFKTVDTFISSWWHYVGQWAWKMSGMSVKRAKEVAVEMIQTTFPNGAENYHYPDNQLNFAETPNQDGTHEYYAEIGFKEGRHSLWPILIHTSEYGNIDEYLKEHKLDMKDLVVSYAYRTI